MNLRIWKQWDSGSEVTIHGGGYGVVVFNLSCCELKNWDHLQGVLIIIDVFLELE